MHVLVINSGSSSLKYSLVDTAKDVEVVQGIIERVGERGLTHRDALGEVLKRAAQYSVDAVGHRVVHGGEQFCEAVEIDAQVLAAIEGCVHLAPLHNPANLAGIRAAMDTLPKVPHVAVFDTAFHAKMPRRARTYGTDLDVSQRLGLRRYGFHGTSHGYIAQKAADYLETPLRDLRLVTLHLGNGASACAVEYGTSVETSMGMTPLEGLLMGTRSGDLDPGVVLNLVRAEGLEATEELLNRSSGLKGLSGVSHDLRDIQQRAEDGDDRCRLAINVFAHRCRKYIGAYAAVMGGLDGIVLTGGIGENSADMRRRILQRLDFLGVHLDEDRNRDAKVSDASPVSDISATNSRVRALVVATNEERVIAGETARVLVGQRRVNPAPGPIPIAVSARHVHLNREAMDVLFGKGSELTFLRPLSQPGQFAAQETLTIVGPRRAIEGVRVLGPLRSQCQVEISRTDEFTLGVDAPVRHSGKIEGSAPITLVGPKGTLDLKEGLICAWRHIHMPAQSAQAYGVVDGDYVEVAITGGHRDLVFGDVVVRVSDAFALEMHIDTDEANAAELTPNATGALVYTGVAGMQAELRGKARSA